ncbi:MAG TPA: hypothetical protein VHY22_14980 [Chthoniobacteraceae bacterium]|jgi:hypothetical protein|nr:hypothetical protein [Chthoniobacteraceae bacterium]
MKRFVLSALALGALVFAARADDNSAGTALVTNNHGGYNVVQPGAQSAAVVLPFFGSHGYAAHVIAQSHTEKPKFILKPVVQDVGHGQKIVVYKRIYFATAEDAEAAKAKQ